MNVRTETNNALLSALSGSDSALLAPFLTPIELPRWRKLERRDGPIEFVYFIENGVATTVADARTSQSVEVGMIGNEGFVGISAAMGVSRSPYDTYMQVAGSGQRIAIGAFAAALDQSASLRKQMLRFAHDFGVQVMRTAQANGRRSLDERLARCLLMLHDRLAGDEVPLTHECLSGMLGVRRAGVSVAAKKLERCEAIALHRAAILIRSRTGLEETCNGSYGPFERAGAYKARVSNI